METSKLKNIVLLILVLTNLLLLALVVSQRLETRQLQRQALADAVSLLQERGIAVAPEVLEEEDFPPALQVERDSGWETQVFTALLGEGTTYAQRGLVTFYTGPKGEAEARSDGGFSVTFTQGAYPLPQDQDMVSYAELLVKRLGFTAHLSAQDGERITVTQAYTKSGPQFYFPVFSCAVTVEYRDGEAVSMAGTRLLGKPSKTSQVHTPLSLAALLVKFRGGIIESGDACTALRGVTRGYVLSADGSVLTPVLQVETDTGRYYLSALTGEFFQV